MSAKRPLFKVGDYVVATDQSFGWGQVAPGMVGRVVKVIPINVGIYEYAVKFAIQDNWRCTEKDLRAASPLQANRAKAYLIGPSKTITAPAATKTPTAVAAPSFNELAKVLKDMATIQHYDPLAGRPMMISTDHLNAAKPERHRMPSHLKGVKVGSQVRVRKPDLEDGEEYFNVGDVFFITAIDYDEKLVRGYSHKYGNDRWIGFIAVTSDLEASDGKVDFDSVILADDKKKKILATIKQVDNHSLIFEEWGFGDVLEKGTAISMLFYGPPGTGKTLAAQAIADKLGKELKVIGSAEIESSEPGQAERNIKAFFEGTKANTVLLFDECDSLVYSREHVGSILAAQVNQLLSSLEKFTGIVIFTTNRLGVLDEAFNRRLSLKIEFDMPTFNERMKIWQRMFPKKAPLADDVSWEKLAKVELSGGYIKNAVLRAARMAAAEEIKDKDKKITMKHLVDALTDEVTGYIEFEEARKGNHTPKLMGGGMTRTIGHTRTTETGVAQ